MTAGTCHQTQKQSLMWLAVAFQAFQPPPHPPSDRHWFNDTARRKTLCKNATLNRSNELQACSFLMHLSSTCVTCCLYNARNKVQWGGHWNDVTGQATRSLSSDTVWLGTWVQYQHFGEAFCLHLQNVQHHVWYFRNIYTHTHTHSAWRLFNEPTRVPNIKVLFVNKPTKAQL